MDSIKPIPQFASKLQVLANEDMVILSFIDSISSSKDDEDSLEQIFSRIAITPKTAKGLRNALNAYVKDIGEKIQEDKDD